jgi:hypothetical protein
VFVALTAEDKLIEKFPAELRVIEETLYDPSVTGLPLDALKYTYALTRPRTNCDPVTVVPNCAVDSPVFHVKLSALMFDMIKPYINIDT